MKILSLVVLACCSCSPDLGYLDRPDGVVDSGSDVQASTPRRGPGGRSDAGSGEAPAPRSLDAEAEVSATADSGAVDHAPTPDLLAPAPDLAVAEAGGDLTPARDFSGPDRGVVDLRSELADAASDAREAGQEVGREAGREAQCPAECRTGCNVGCSPDGRCVACSTCECDVTTGICHC